MDRVLNIHDSFLRSKGNSTQIAAYFTRIYEQQQQQKKTILNLISNGTKETPNLKPWQPYSLI